MNKKLGVSEVFAILLGAIIGWGSFMLPGTKFLPNSGVINTSIGLFVGTMAIVMIERSYRYMLQQDIDEGGEFSYILIFMGRKNAFVVGWFLFLAYLSLVPLNATAFPLVIDKLFPGALNFGYLYTVAGDPIYIGEVLVSVLIVLFFMALNLRGIKQSGKVQFVIVAALIVCVLAVFAAMLFKADKGRFYENYVADNGFNLSQVVQVVAITPFLFIGFDAIPQLVKDMNISRKKASLMAVTALLIGMSCYIMLNFTTGLAYGPQEAKALDWALGNGVLENLGMVGFLLLVIALGSAVAGGINGFMICSTKLMSSMGNQNILPTVFGKKNHQGILRNAILIVSVISMGACFFGREVVTWIVDMCSFGAAVTYFYVCFNTLMIGKARRVRIEAAIGALFGLSFMLLLIIPVSPAALSTPALIFLGVWVAAGALFFVRLCLKDRRRPYVGDNEMTH